VKITKFYARKQFSLNFCVFILKIHESCIILDSICIYLKNRQLLIILPCMVHHPPKEANMKRQEHPLLQKGLYLGSCPPLSLLDLSKNLCKIHNYAENCSKYKLPNISTFTEAGPVLLESIVKLVGIPDCTFPFSRPGPNAFTLEASAGPVPLPPKDHQRSVSGNSNNNTLCITEFNYPFEPKNFFFSNFFCES
jgi:hypothetical protein